MQVPRLARQGLLLVVGFLAVLNIFIFHTILAPRELRVTVLDVGQGDAILIEGPTGTTMLIDAGKGRAVLRELGETLPFWERSIDIVVATHPDADHIGGLPDVFESYAVGTLIESGVLNDTAQTRALSAAARAEPMLERMVAKRGMRLNLGGGAYADILYPDRDVSKVATNDSSVVLRVVYGATSFLFSGDLAGDIEEWLIALDAPRLNSDFLKAGHHGSTNSTSEAWLAAVSPAVVAVSAGRGNSYGHPTPEVLERVREAGAIIKRTDLDGRLVFRSDGFSID
jgi:competence protein ComEC